MREQLLGYLLGALEPAEQEEVESQLSEDAQLRQDLAQLRGNLAWLGGAPLEEDCPQRLPGGLWRPHRDDYEPPAGLAARTCGYVAAQAAKRPQAAAASLPPAAIGLPAPASWRLADIVVGGGVFLAACMLIFPAIAHSLSHARVANCQNNLRAIGLALGQYSDHYGGFFPLVPQQGPLAAAGVYGPLLSDLKLIDKPAVLVCPASPLAGEREPFTVPSLAQVAETPRGDLQRVQSRIGGSYGYGLGYNERGRYRGHRNRGRMTFALMADSPGEPGSVSPNHGEVGQNVLFEDLHVAFLKHCRLAGCEDHIYVNEHGYVGAGIGPDDAVIGRSSARPVTFQLAPAR